MTRTHLEEVGCVNFKKKPQPEQVNFEEEHETNTK
jgi:hypothetical protein